MHQAHATSSLLSGNNFFSVRNYKGAVSSYTDGINILLSSKETSKDSNTNNKSFTMQQQQLLAVLYSNRSGANLLLANGNQALEDANNALGLNDQRSKFYGRKGSAHHFLGQYQDAIDSYEKGLDLVNGSEHIGLKEGLKAVKLAKQQSRMLGDGMTEGPSQLAGHKRPRSPPSSSHQSTVVGDSNTTTSTSSAASSSLSSSISATKTTVNVLDDFVADVSIIGATVKKLERAVDDSKLGSPNEELSRILQKNHKWINLNPYEVLDLPHDVATEEDIKQRYRALCGLIHPDKNCHEGAREAFEYVSAAHKELMNEQRRTIIVNIINNAHDRAKQEMKKEFMKSKGLNESIKKKLLQQRKIKLTRITFAQAEEAKQKAEKNKQAYRKREDDQSKEEKEKLKKNYQHEKEWNKGVDDRVDSWQSFAGIKKVKK